MSSVSETLKRVIIDKAPLIACALVMLIMTYLPNVAAVELVSVLMDDSSMGAQLAYCALSAAMAFLLLWLFERWYSPQYKGTITLEGAGAGLKVLLPVIVFWVVWIVIKVAMGFYNAYPLDLESFLKGLRPGVLEESSYRGMAMGIVLCKYHKKGSVWLPVVFTSVVFGLMHLTNLFGEDLTSEIAIHLMLNVLFACAFGAIFAMTFTLCGSVWPTLVVHSAYDTALNCLLYTDASPEWLAVVDILATIALMVFTAVLFYRSRDKTEALWDKKWGISQ